MNNTALLFVLIVFAVGVKESIQQGKCTTNFCTTIKDSAACNGCCRGIGCTGGGQCSVLNGVSACHCDGCTSKPVTHDTCTSTFCSSGKLDDNGCKGCCVGMLNGCGPSGSCQNSHCKCNTCVRKTGPGP
ncbi:keratin-associated protein 5-2-like [Mytilus trossulus]|uniref:keratin-associated protein 5-2-like n=1 Tax=Mytilus trossulus TaxID=6551 RepID=UPI0030041A26